jgi:hypothetical protein
VSVNPPDHAPQDRPPEDDTVAALAALSREEREVVLRVVEILRRLQFGTVLLVVQDGKVVQIEMAEKFRLR